MSKKFSSKMITWIMIALLMGLGVGVALVGQSIYPSKTSLITILKTSHHIETITIMATETRRPIKTRYITETVTEEKTNILTTTMKLTEVTTSFITKTFCGPPEFFIRQSDDPNIDFYVMYCGDILVSKARAQLWDYRNVPGDEISYLHLLIGYLDNGEWRFAEGFEGNTTLITSEGRYLEWINQVHETAHNFDSRTHVRIFTINGYPIIEVEAEITPKKCFENVVDLYVELGRKSGGFKWTAIKVGDKIIKKNMVYTGEEKYLAHYFEDRWKLLEYGWIAGRTLNDEATLALVFKSAEIITHRGDVERIEEITPSAMDTAGHYDTIELHLIEAPWDNPETLKTGDTYRLKYYILMSEEKGYEWIDDIIKFLQT